MQALVISVLVVVGRVLFGGFFISAGVDHLQKVNLMAPYAAAKSVPVPKAAVRLTGVQLIVGGLSIAGGFWPQVGVLLIALFLLPTSLIMHGFWKHTDPQARQMDTIQFKKNIALLGGALMLLAIPQPWVWSL
jgi:uncharacterized membrane protein YphA (DoxX/SURF4 family)